MDIRLRAAEGDMYTYPDVMALCGQPQFDERSEGGVPSLLNPQVIFEILSLRARKPLIGKKNSGVTGTA